MFLENLNFWQNNEDEELDEENDLDVLECMDE